MKTKLMIGLTLALLAVARIASAQGTVGGTIGSWPGGPVSGQVFANTFVNNGVQPLVDFSSGSSFTALAGDVVFLDDPNGGTDSSNWRADLRFSNPLDPTGQQGLAATESQLFVASELGNNGFANFQLLPQRDVSAAVWTTIGPGFPTSGDLITSYNVFGSDGVLDIYTIRVAPIPEPGTLALLGLGGIALALNARRRRT